MGDLTAVRSVDDLAREYGELFAAVVRYITRRGYSVHEAEDAAQDAIEALLGRLDEGEAIANPRGWVRRFAHFQLARERRAHARLLKRAADDWVPYSRKGAQRPSSIRPAQLQAVKAMLTPAEYGVLAFRLAGMTGREAGEALGITGAAYWSRLHAVRRKLRAAGQ